MILEGNFEIHRDGVMNMEDYGFVESAEDAQKLITAYETKHTVKFACFKADKDFGKKGK